MSKKEKLWLKAKDNQKGLTFDEFCRLMDNFGWTKDHQTGSHQIWYSPNKQRISVQNKNGKAKEYQVKQFLALINEEQKNG